MKYLCPSCERLVSPTHVEQHDARIEISCPKCGAREQLDLDEEHPESTDLDETDADTTPSKSGASQREESSNRAEKQSCPKCGARRTDEHACPKCGLIYDRWQPDEGGAPPPNLILLWQKLERRWGESNLHARFLKEAFDADALAYAARCYRTHDDDVAARQLEALTTLGVQAMQRAEQPSAVTPRIARTIGWVLFVLLCMTLATLAVLTLR